jgi:hypothetical protein
MEGAGDGGGGAGDGGKKVTAPEVFSREYVHELREENKSWRTKHSESESARKTAEDAAKAADTTSQGKIKEVQTAADQRVIRAELKAAALKAGMVDLDGLKLADLTKVKLNDEGEVEGADELMVAMQKAKPYLFAEPSTSHTGKPPPKDDQKVKKATDMTDAEYAAARAAAIRR